MSESGAFVSALTDTLVDAVVPVVVNARQAEIEHINGRPMTVEELETHIDELDAELSNNLASLRAIVRYTERLQQMDPYGKRVVVRFSATGDCLGATIDGIESDRSVVLCGDMEQVDDGYVVSKDGARYRYYRTGQKTWWLMLGDEVAFVSTCNPLRTVVDGAVVYEWGKA